MISAIIKLLLFTVVSASMLASCSCEDIFGGGDGDSGPRGSEAGVISVNPTSISFSATFDDGGLPIPSDTVLRIENNGQGNLRINNIALNEQGSLRKLSTFPLEDSEFARACPDIAESGSFELPDRRSPDNHCVIGVRFTPNPSDPARAQGNITINSNDPRNGELVVPITSIAAGPDINVDPPTVFFEDVVAGERETQILTITNRGTMDLTIDSMDLTTIIGNFSWVYNPESPITELPATLRPIAFDINSVIILDITYAPPADHSGSEQNALRIESNSFGNEILDVPIQAGSLQPCIDIQPDESLEFGEVLIGSASEQPVRITNCGDIPIHLNTLGLTADTHPDFGIVTSSLPAGFTCSGDTELSCEGELEIGLGESYTVFVEFAPESETLAQGNLVIRAESNGDFEKLLPLAGRGTFNTPPVCVAEARLAGSPQYRMYPDQSSPLEAIPLQTVEMTAENSQDPDGHITAYRWTVCGRPEDSAAQIAPNNNQMEVEFFLDLAGVYCFELEVWDNHGMACEERAQVWVEVVPDDNLHVQLVWGSHSYTGEGAVGIDLDLHLLHPMGTWWDNQWDCHWRNREPDWGVQGDDSDSPRLDIDDLVGPGPENINILSPSNGVTYTVGVHYWDESQPGPALATVRIYLWGELRWVKEHRVMSQVDDLWTVATIAWPSGAINEVNNITHLPKP